jgi:hypothetical protein
MAFRWTTASGNSRGFIEYLHRARRPQRAYQDSGEDLDDLPTQLLLVEMDSVGARQVQLKLRSHDQGSFGFHA